MLKFPVQTAGGNIGICPEGRAPVEHDGGISGNDRIIMPLELCDVPGVINQHIAYTMGRAIYPNQRTATIGAIAMVAFAASRGYRMEDNTRTPLYLVAAANSGAGKDEPRKTNADIARKCGAGANVGDTVASGEGLQDWILERTKVLLQNDEFDTLLRAINADKGGNKESLVQQMLTIATSAGGYLNRRRTSIGKDKPQATDYCVHPSLTLFGSAVPDVLFSAITERTLHNGLLARCLIADCGVRQGRNKNAKWSEPPQELVDAYRDIFGGLDTVGQEGEYTRTLIDQPRKARDDMRIVRIAPDADARLDEIIDECDAAISKLDYATGKSGEQAILSRRAELTKRCAMVYAISENPLTPMISVPAVNWAYAFVKFCQEGMLRLVDLYAASNVTDDRMKRVRRMFAKRREITAREIYRGLRLPKRDVEDVLEAMVACGEIIDVEDGHRFRWVG